MLAYGAFELTLLILTQRPWLLQYSSPVVRMQVPFFGSMLHLHNFLLCGDWLGLSQTEISVFPDEFPGVEEDDTDEVDDESLHIL